MNRLFVWLSRIHHCRGFGIQSPTDYAFVRYVVNEHWPYYAYDELHEGDWLRKKLGRLYFRLANWRQPTHMLADEYQAWWHAGCKKTKYSPLTSHLSPLPIELARINISQWGDFQSLLPQCDQQTVLVIEDIWRNWSLWREIARSPQTGTTFDLYYCGIVFFDTKRFKHNYIINF